MAPTCVHLIRHAQGYHNLSSEGNNIHDPELTAEGKKQSVQLASEIDNIQAVDCIVASPFRRTLWTALITFRDLLESRPDLKIIALPELQEISNLPCDTGTDLDQLKEEMADKPIDWTYVHNDWNSKFSGRYAQGADLVANRALMSRRFLQSREEQRVAVVTHGGFLHFMTEDWMDYAKYDGTGWANTEMRTYEFDFSSIESISNASIRETSSSIAQRKPSLQPLTMDEQIQLQVVAYRLWAENGYLTLSSDESNAEDPDGISCRNEKDSGVKDDFPARL